MMTLKDNNSIGCKLYLCGAALRLASIAHEQIEAGGRDEWYGGRGLPTSARVNIGGMTKDDDLPPQP